MERLTKRISENIIELSAKANPIQYNGIPQRVHVKHPFWNVFTRLCDYEDAEEQGLHRWIPCGERLPEEDIDVLLCIKDAEGNYYQMVTYFHIVWQTEVGGMYGAPVAWMPMPEPYEGE